MAGLEEVYSTGPTALYSDSSNHPTQPLRNDSCRNLNCYMVLNDTEKMVIGSICFLAGPVTFLENAMVLALIGATPSLRHRPSYLFIGSLALADVFASCFFTISFLDFHLYRRRDGESAYLFKLGGVTLAFTGSVGSLLLTAMDRYICIHRASQYKTVLTHQRALAGLAVLWATTFLVSFLPLLGWTCPTELEPPCSQLFPYIDHRYLACWVGFILVLLALILSAYALILWQAHRHEASMAGLQSAPGGNARMRMDIRLARMLALILLILVGCWLPVLSFMLADVVVHLTPAHQRAFAFCSTLCLVNSAVNPLLYALRCRELRGALRQLLGRARRCGCRCSHWMRPEGGGSSSSSGLGSEGEEAGRLTSCTKKSLSQRVDTQQLEVIRK